MWRVVVIAAMILGVGLGLGYFFGSTILNPKTDLGQELINKLKLDEEVEGWISGKSGDPAAEEVADIVSIEFSEELCLRSEGAACGFEEHEGKFSDVANAVKYALTQLNGKVNINVRLNPEGGYEVSEFGNTPEEEFDASKPVRFIYFDANKNQFYKKADTFSYGWGIDPSTGGLVFVIAEASANSKWWYDSKMLIALDTVIGGISMTGDRIIDSGKHEQLFTLWFGGSERSKLTPEQGATLKIKDF